MIGKSPDETDEKSDIRLGISSCLLGEEVRYNGGHSRDEFMLRNLGQFVRWISVCPEVESGMGVPRESVRLVGDPEVPRMVGSRSGTDFTDRMQGWNHLKIDQLVKMNLHGYVFKSGSPSCGLMRVKVYNSESNQSVNGSGLFPAALKRAIPLLPMEEEGRLHDNRLRENFIERIFVYARWSKLLSNTTRPRDLVAFHSDHKLILMAHSPKGQTTLGRIVADSGNRPFDDVLEEYGRECMTQLAFMATIRKHTNVLHHLMGYIKTQLDGEDKVELLEVIDQYRLGYVPLIVPITLLKHHLRRNNVPAWVTRQVYLNPYPNELMLRNHV